MDRPGHDPAVLADNLYDLRVVNRWLGGARLTISCLERLTERAEPRTGPLRLLDVAAGGADISRVLLGWARRRRRGALVVATDLSHEILRLATDPPRPGLAFAVCDGLRLPFADRTFDAACCSLVLHHLVPEQAVRLLREMRRVSRLGVVVNDVVRWWPGVWGAWLMSRLFSRNPLTRHDGPLSVRRAYTRAELRALVARAGLRRISFEGFMGYRVALAAA
jgi:ubiquinone/menaquinone biosynthesis C-methylase UbiE